MICFQRNLAYVCQKIASFNPFGIKRLSIGLGGVSELDIWLESNAIFDWDVGGSADLNKDEYGISHV